LDDVAVELRLDTLRIDDLAAIVREVKVRHRYLAGRAVDLHVCDRPDIGAGQLVFDIRHAPAFQDIAGLLDLTGRPRLPFGERDQPVEQFESAFVVEVFSPKCYWIALRL